MSKLTLINEIETTVKMSSENYDQTKLKLYLDELLSKYKFEEMTLDTSTEYNEKYLDMYLNALKIENYSSLTLKNYRYQLKSFLSQINKNVLTTTTADIRNYLSEFNELKQSSIVMKLDIISGFFNWLINEDELLKNPCAKIKRPKLPKKVKDGLSIVELEQVRNSCENIFQRALIEVFYSTGCRLSELTNMDIDDIEWNNNSIIVLGKGNKERRVYLSDKAAWYLRKYLKSRNDECEALFVSSRKPIRRLSNDGVYFTIKKIHKQSGIERKLSPHLLRHTFSQLSLDNGMEISDLQSLLGHESADTTARYAKVSEERKYMAFKKYHAQ